MVFLNSKLKDDEKKKKKLNLSSNTEEYQKKNRDNEINKCGDKKKSHMKEENMFFSHIERKKN